MDFDIHKRDAATKDQYEDEARNIAYDFAEEIHGELEDLLKAVVLFGSVARNASDSNDIDVLLLVDDVRVQFTDELVQTYRVIVKKTAGNVSDRLHITSMKFTSFWEYIRTGDPIATNILRDGYALIDTGVFEPLQHLLRQGRIEPSEEALWTYMNRAEQSMTSADQRLLETLHDLYWAAIDASHAALIHVGEAPPSPRHVASLLEKTLIEAGELYKKDAELVRRLYTLSKDVSKGKRTSIQPKELRHLQDQTRDYVDRVQDVVYDD
jgi:predicted nucleotidyltransferase